MRYDITMAPGRAHHHAAAVDIGILKRLYMFSPFDAPIRNLTLGMSFEPDLFELAPPKEEPQA
jgi:hypothetical protein